MIVIVIMSMRIQKNHRIPIKIKTVHQIPIGDCAGFGVDLELDLG